MINLASVKSILLLFGSVAFSFNFGNTIHELGHTIADIIGGVDSSNIKIVLHPFLSPHMEIQGGIPDNLMGFPDAAGPLANIVISLIFFVAIWKIRNPNLLPFLMLAPLACIQEGMNLAININQAGTDSARIIASGIPSPIILITGILLIMVGIVSFAFILPVARVPNSFWKGLVIIGTGLILYPLIMIIYIFCTSSPATDLSRSFNITGGFIILAIMLSLVHQSLRQLIKKIHKKEYSDLT